MYRESRPRYGAGGPELGKTMPSIVAREGVGNRTGPAPTGALVDANVAEINAAGGKAIGALAVADVTKRMMVRRMVDAAVASSAGRHCRQ